MADKLTFIDFYLKKIKILKIYLKNKLFQQEIEILCQLNNKNIIYGVIEIYRKNLIRKYSKKNVNNVMITSNGDSIMLENIRINTIGYSNDKPVIIGFMVKNTVKRDNLIWNCPWS